MEAIAQSCVLVGVVGAGLQWGMFMPAGSTVNEIAWPKRHWGFYYNMFLSKYGVATRQLEDPPTNVRHLTLLRSNHSCSARAKRIL